MTDVMQKQGERAHAHGAAAGRAVGLLGIGTAAPESLTQEEAMTLAQEFSCESDGQRAWLKRVFTRSGVEQRGTVLRNGRGIEDVRGFYGPPAEAGLRGPTTATRMERYIKEAPLLAERAARAALSEARVEPQRITHIITVSCTGFSAPGLDTELIERLGLARNVRRLHVGFMGCHAAFNALAAARDAVRADANARVLVCCVELSTLHFAYGWNPEKLVANALFADGATACIMGAAEDGEPEPRTQRAGPSWRLLETASLLLPESRDAMTWHIGDHGFEMTLSAELPALIGRHIRPWCEAWLRDAGVSLRDVRQWAIHPGGPKILAAAMEALGLAEADVAVSRSVLARHGNMSSATLLFLLSELAKSEGERGLCVAIGFGPGLMAEGLLLDAIN